ncbi:hypothetical protein [Pseudogemmobacter sonorensis]|uniref:hypothetical protein n=1 Tax=Pseudogemmobacter sonorensis TaxID=2989681 RepID=UPI00367FA0E6
MLHFRNFAVAPAFVLLMGGTAHAALTADQIWQGWQDSAAAVGIALSAATESRGDGVLTLNGLRIGLVGHDEAATVSFLTLTEVGDGSVLIEPGDSISFAQEDDGLSATAELTHEGFALVASEGEAGAIHYDFAADTLEVNFSAEAEGYSFTDEPAQPLVTGGAMSFTDLAGRYSDTPGANRVFDLAVAVAGVSYEISSEDPNFGSSSHTSSETEDVTLGASLTLPSGIALTEIESGAQFSTALREGLALSMAGSQGVSVATSHEANEFFPMEVSATGQPGSWAFVADQERIALESESEGLSFQLNMPELPAPLELTMGTARFDMLVPVITGGESGDYALSFSIVDILASDAAWDMFDPEGVLPRDPAALNVDLSGSLVVDLPDFLVGGDASVAEPVLESLDIADISVSVAGAALQAVGAFVFDNSLGTPVPNGEADVTLTGATGLIAGLSALGLISEMDAAMASAMIDAYMVPGDAPDSLEARIEIDENGMAFVNGQPLQ